MEINYYYFFDKVMFTQNEKKIFHGYDYHVNQINVFPIFEELSRIMQTKKLNKI